MYRNAGFADLGDHPFSNYAKFSEKPTFITAGYVHIYVGIRG